MNESLHSNEHSSPVVTKDIETCRA